MMHRFKLRKQGAVKYPGQHGAAKRAGDLSHDIGHHFSAREAGKQPQGDGDRGVQMSPEMPAVRYTAREIPSPQIIQISHSPRLAPVSFRALRQQIPKTETARCLKTRRYIARVKNHSL